MSWDSHAKAKTIRLSLKGQCSFQLEISECFPFFDAILTVSIRIRNTAADLRHFNCISNTTYAGPDLYLC